MAKRLDTPSGRGQRGWIGVAVCWTLAAMLGVLMAVLHPYDDTDPQREGFWRSRSGLALYTDNKTGCQYVKAGLFGGITPRLDEQGRPICRK